MKQNNVTDNDLPLLGLLSITFKEAKLTRKTVDKMNPYVILNIKEVKY
jgi:hypothetical protein